MNRITRKEFLKKSALDLCTIPAGLNRLSAQGSTQENAKAQSQFTVKPTGRFTPVDEGRALVNPGMGWTMHFYTYVRENYGAKLVPSDTIDYFPGVGAVYLRIPWAFIEPEEGHFVWEILDTPAQRWIEKGKQVAFRITALEDKIRSATPEWVFKAGAKYYEADDLIEPDYDDPVFLEKVENFVSAMAARYDGLPSTAFVDIGHYGMWGEGHTVFTSPKHGHFWGIEVQKKMIDLYCRHFKRSQLCISDDYAGHNLRGERFPITDYAYSRGVTLRDDSILCAPKPNNWYHSEMAQLFWPKFPVILEHQHYRDSLQNGAWDKELLLQSVEDYHASFMSIHWYPDVLWNENRDIIERINRRIGYRLQMPEIQWPAQVRIGKSFAIQSKWRNAGVAPCYKGGYPCFTIKDAKGGIVAVLVDDTLDVKSLPVALSNETATTALSSAFLIAPTYTDNVMGVHPSRTCETGTYDLFFSVGDTCGTPRYELPYPDSDGHKRYHAGRITLT
jgi:hypothetical protein